MPRSHKPNFTDNERFGRGKIIKQSKAKPGRINYDEQSDEELTGEQRELFKIMDHGQQYMQQEAAPAGEGQVKAGGSGANNGMGFRGAYHGDMMTNHGYLEKYQETHKFTSRYVDVETVNWSELYSVDLGIGTNPNPFTLVAGRSDIDGGLISYPINMFAPKFMDNKFYSGYSNLYKKVRLLDVRVTIVAKSFTGGAPWSNPGFKPVSTEPLPEGVPGIVDWSNTSGIISQINTAAGTGVGPLVYGSGLSNQREVHVPIWMYRDIYNDFVVPPASDPTNPNGYNNINEVPQSAVGPNSYSNRVGQSIRNIDGWLCMAQNGEEIHIRRECGARGNYEFPTSVLKTWLAPQANNDYQYSNAPNIMDLINPLEAGTSVAAVGPTNPISPLYEGLNILCVPVYAPYIMWPAQYPETESGGVGFPLPNLQTHFYIKYEADWELFDFAYSSGGPGRLDIYNNEEWVQEQVNAMNEAVRSMAKFKKPRMLKLNASVPRINKNIIEL